MVRTAELPVPRPSSTGLVLQIDRGPEIDVKPVRTKRQALERYAGWVYAAVSAICWDVRSQPWEIWRKLGNRREDWQALTRREIPGLFFRPNAQQSWGDLVEATQLQMDLTGEAFWAMITEADGGTPIGLQLVYSHWVSEPVFSEEPPYRLAKWKVEVPGRLRREIPAEDMIFFRYPHPLEPFMGASPVEAFALSYDMDLYARAYGATLLKNFSIPAIALTTDIEDLREEQADLIRERWLDRHYNRPGEPAVLGKGVKVEKIGFSVADLQFAEIAQLSMEQIFAIYKYPASMAGIRTEGGLSEAASKVDERTYQRNGLRPRLRRFDETIDMRLMPRLFKDAENLAFEFEDPVSEDSKWELEKTTELVGSSMITVNQGLSRLGLEEQRDGDVYLVKAGVLRIPAGSLDKPELVPSRQEQRSGSHILEPGGERAELAELRFLRAQDNLERALKSRIRAQFTREQKATIEALRRQERRGVERRDWVDEAVNGSSKEWIDLLREFILRGFANGWSLFEAESAKSVSFNVYEAKAQQFAARNAGTKVKEILQTTLDALRKVLSEAVETGMSIDRIAEAIARLYDEFKGTRSETIARTETANAVNTGKHEAAVESARRLDLVLKKRWVATLDDRTRESHAAANGSTRPLSEPFEMSSGATLKHPGDPNGPASEVIRCRCTLAYYEE